MEYTISFREETYQSLVNHLFQDRHKERAAYLLCGISKSDGETRLLVRDMILVADADIEESSASHMKIHSGSYVQAIKVARETKQCFIFVHSHPRGFPRHSTQDDSEEEVLFRTVYERAPDAIHASMVFSDPNMPYARVWLANGSTASVSVIRSIGNRFRFFDDKDGENAHPEFFDRQIRAFGKDVQTMLQKLKIGIVGVGGTGSAVAEQLIRLGVGTLFVFDHDTLETTNVNRVYGSHVSDAGKTKVEIIQRLAKDIGLGTSVKAFQKPISFKSTVEELKKCDVVFGCTDDNWGRSILCRLTTYYYIPVLDMGVKIDSEDELIRSIHGRTTVLIPGHACLFCRGRINGQMLNSEIAEATNPAEAAERRKEGYIPELPDTAPAVIPFTTITASTSVAEFLHRITGYLGSERETSEVVHLFDQERIGKNRRDVQQGCFCGDAEHLGQGDVNTHSLGLTWRNEI